MFALNDTIAALASVSAPAERGIVRISGPRTLEVLADMIPGTQRQGRAAQRFPAELRLANARAPLALEIQLWPDVRSYTGQPLAELHTVGSPPVLQTILATVYRSGARPAQPGEFTLRAFLAGKLDLLQAEAVLGVIDAGDDRELQTALQQLAGGISQRMALIRSDLIELLADLEAGLDFVEEHIEFVEHAEVCRRVAAAKVFVDQLCRQVTTRMHAGERPKVLLAGLPNAGKSTLFNWLVGADRALVSPIGGTTRDYLSAPWNCAGLSVDLVDTAGWEEPSTGISQAMSDVREDQLQRADLIIWCTAADLPPSDQQLNQNRRSAVQSRSAALLPVLTKCDGTDESEPSSSVKVSVHTGRGLDRLADEVRARILDHRAGDRQWLGSSAVRCAESLRSAAAALAEAEQVSHSRAGEELLAAELRLALDHLGIVVGAVYTDDLLDRIFSKFCIGK
ncbi:MAG: GTPase [Planctomycetaceae bacterium]|nr:GTPase [Planctomycetaceae bacterium]